MKFTENQIKKLEEILSEVVNDNIPEYVDAKGGAIISSMIMDNNYNEVTLSFKVFKKREEVK